MDCPTSTIVSDLCCEGTNWWIFVGRSTQLELCLLYYFAGHHDDAWEELQMMQADQPESEASQEEALLPLFMQKLKLCRSLESSEA